MLGCSCCTLSVLGYGLGAVFVLYIVLAKLLAPRPLSLRNKTVVITGGSSGIGLATAKQAAKEGANVHLIARNAQQLAEAAAEVNACTTSESQTVATHPCDVTDDAAVKTVFDAILSSCAGIDMLLCSAGMSRATLFEDLPAADFERVMQVNVSGCANAARAVVPAMKRRRSGRIYFVSSAAGQLGVFGYGAYSASKFALRGLAEVLQMELRPFGIRVGLCFPPDVNTPMLQRENKEKPRECIEISGSTSTLQPDQVGKELLDGAKRGDFFVNFGVDGMLLAWLTAGAAPITTLWECITQVFMTGLARFIFMFYLVMFDRICAKGAKRRAAAEAAKN